MRMTLDIYRDMLMALGAALTAVYFLLVAYYKSFLIPLIAMSAVPLGIIGIFPGHWLLGTDFSATSIVGIIALRSEEHTSELQSLMRTSYAVFCLKTKTAQQRKTH